MDGTTTHGSLFLSSERPLRVHKEGHGEGSIRRDPNVPERLPPPPPPCPAREAIHAQVGRSSGKDHPDADAITFPSTRTLATGVYTAVLEADGIRIGVAKFELA